MAKATEIEQELPNYGNPPVIEVVCGLTFNPMPGFLVPHFGLLWERFRAEFPKCQHANPLGAPPDLQAGIILPRVWFINSSENCLIQVQTNRFIYNWRKTAADESYPRYAKVIKEFKKNAREFSSFLEKNDIGLIEIVECELTYVNHIPKQEGWENLGDLGNLFPDISWQAHKNRFLPAPSNLTWTAQFPLPDDFGTLTLTLKHAQRRVDNLPILVLENSARGRGPVGAFKEVWKWFDVAHRWIVQAFADATALQAQQILWKRHGRTPS